ncbi:MAG: hypothetical protein AB7P21_20845 [Lautropia sp.]
MIQADASNYLQRLRGLQPGETLVLAAGDYDTVDDVPGLPIFDINGTAEHPVVITGPDTGPRPRLLGRSTHNTIRLANASHIVVRNLNIDGRDLGGAGVAAEGIAHHITIENLRITGVGGDQQNVGISTVGSPTWNWTVRGNTIIGAGTGMYFGNSDGTSPFVAGLIEHNLIRDTIGYNIQIKHQNPRPSIAGMPTGRSSTIIRHNVFSKSATSSTGSLARPNLLVGHFPTNGPGMDDDYQIYGNFFWQNPTETLFQGEGNIAFYSNLLVNHGGSGVMIQPHHDVPKTIRIFGNTIIAAGIGVRVSGSNPGHVQRVEKNAVFAATPVTAADQADNTTASLVEAGNTLASPVNDLTRFDASPRPGALTANGVAPTGIGAYGYATIDFDMRARDWQVRGAYAAESVEPKWRPGLELKH